MSARAQAAYALAALSAIVRIEFCQSRFSSRQERSRQRRSRELGRAFMAADSRNPMLRRGRINSLPTALLDTEYEHRSRSDASRGGDRTT
jgi:hypothetical protein